jgi:hypothetical protein
VLYKVSFRSRGSVEFWNAKEKDAVVFREHVEVERVFEEL